MEGAWSHWDWDWENEISLDIEIAWEEGLQDDCSKDIFEMELEDMEEPADDVENDGAGDSLIEYFSTA